MKNNTKKNEFVGVLDANINENIFDVFTITFK